MTRRRECGSKEGYPSGAAAHRALWSFIRRVGASPVQYHVYRCPHCRLYHYGHRPTRRRR